MLSTLTTVEAAALEDFRSTFALMLAGITADADVLPHEDMKLIVLETTVCVLASRRLSPIPALLRVASKTAPLLLSSMTGTESEADLLQALRAYASEFSALTSSRSRAA
jgi:hypothetical protein